MTSNVDGTGKLLAYYGDDFTGSTDALEALTSSGLSTVLFLEEPTPSLVARFPDARCIGLAGASRGRDPRWMEEHLPRAFASLAAFGAPILHYKVCSTFDSSPQIGSIGRAIDIGVGLMGGRWSPAIVGTPPLRRYQVFGHLFAAAGTEGIHRLDRHPTMSRHPVTPMREADLVRHLREQTARRIDLIDLVSLRDGTATDRLDQLSSDDAPVIFLDVLDNETLLEAGRLVWEGRGAGLFSASSSGLSYALTAYWRSVGMLPMASPMAPAGPRAQIAAVSGSCSPVTAQQIRCARDAGFATERLRLPKVLDSSLRETEIERCAQTAVNVIREGGSVIVYSAEGPDDPAVLGFADLALQCQVRPEEAGRRIGRALAEVMVRVLDRTEVARIAIAGGDSSGEVTSMLGIDALTMLAPLAPGAPLCRAASTVDRRNGLEIVLKGGQMGAPSFFEAVRLGRCPV